MTEEALAQATTENDLHHFLAEQVETPVRKALEGAAGGQRLRVTTLPEPVLDALCQRLGDENGYVVRKVTGDTPKNPWEATATKLIELRNSLAAPLLVLVPPGLRSAAEDSLDIATFNELSLQAFGGGLSQVLLARLPDKLQRQVEEALAYLREERRVRNDDELVDYLLTVIKNGATPRAAGVALYVLGLVPDGSLFDRHNVSFWLSKNAKCCEKLANISEPLRSRIGALGLVPGPIQVDLFAFLRNRRSDDIRSWARDIACSPELCGLSFDRWPFTEGTENTGLRLILEPLDLPLQSTDDIGGAAQLPVLHLDGKKPFKVRFRSNPPPAEVQCWVSYRVQLLAFDGDEPTLAWESNSYKRPKGRNRLINRSIKVTDLAATLEEGTYFARVHAYDQDGVLLTTPERLDPSDAESRFENESELFLAVRGDVEIEPTEPRAVNVPSLVDAWVGVASRGFSKSDLGEPMQIDAVRGCWTEPTGAVVRGDAHFRLEGTDFSGYTVLVPGLLRRIELGSLKQPDDLGAYRLELERGLRQADIEVHRQKHEALPMTQRNADFLKARRRVFELILQQHVLRAGNADQEQMRLGVVETADLLSIAEAVEAYAKTYLEIERALEDSQRGPTAGHRRALAMIDVVELRWPRGPGDPGRALLLAPTHPLRLLWHLQHATVCAKAITDLRDGVLKVPSWSVFIEQVRRGLLPMNLPMLLFDARSRAYVEQGLVTSHWSLYLPDRSNGDKRIDVATCRDTARKLLGVRSRGPVSALVPPPDVARRLFEYLVQHPYVDQLRLNVFNPGDGELVADALRQLESMRLGIRQRGHVPPLRYSVQMFGPAQHLDLMGEGLEALLDPDRQVGEDDEFTQAAANHLLPKLVFARNSIDQFLQDPARYSAHMSLFLEQFSVQGHVGSVADMRRGSFVAGLVQESETVLETQGTVFGWHKGVKPQAAVDATNREQLLVRTLQAIHSIQASAANGQTTSLHEAPKLALQLDPRAQGLLRSVHGVSDWVLTIDRNLGLDYFDSKVSAREVGYLIDFAPEYLQEDRQRILLTTRSVGELQHLVQPALERFGLRWVQGDEVPVLEALRSLSGRLALRLLSSPSRSAEVIGLLLARWVLEQVGLLSDRIVIPLDAHQAWFAAADGEVVTDAWSQKRADLLIVGFDPASRHVTMDIVEVKMRSGPLHDAERVYLYKQMRDQADNTEATLRRHFDLEFYPGGRADAAFRAKELTTLLAFYLRRAVRYSLVGSEEAQVALDFVQTLDSGYTLDFRKLGVVFHQEGRGAHVDEDEPGYVVHRLGLDVGNRLLKTARERFGQAMVEAEASFPSKPPEPMEPAPEDADLESFRSQLEGRSKLRVAGPKPRYVVAEGKPLRASEIPEGGSAGVRGFGGKGDGEVEAGTPAAAGEPPVPTAPSPTISTGEAPALPQAPEPEVGITHDADPAPLTPGALLGSSELTAQYGLIGKAGSTTVGVDLTGCNTISLFGVQGFGKSYTLGVIAEMGAKHVAGINVLERPLATVVFHYHKSDAYAPEYATAVRPNGKRREIDRLLADYGARPEGLDDVVLLTPEAKLEDRRREFPELDVRPIKFSSGEIGADGWKFLLGAAGNDSLYVRQLVAIMRRYRGQLTLQQLREDIQAADFAPAIARLAEDRLNLAEPYIDDSVSQKDLLHPGRTVIVDLRDEWVEKEEALGLFVVMMNIFANAKQDGRDFNKLMVFDEAHKYISESDLIGQVVETIREMRHKATSVVIASQDPLSVPRAVIELTTMLVLHRMTSPQWLKHLKSAISSLSETTEAHLATLLPGEALVWAQRCTDKRFTLRPQKVAMRPRFTQHGGGTKTAVSGATIR